MAPALRVTFLQPSMTFRGHVPKPETFTVGLTTWLSVWHVGLGWWRQGRLTQPPGQRRGLDHHKNWGFSSEKKGNECWGIQLNGPTVAQR